MQNLSTDMARIEPRIARQPPKGKVVCKQRRLSQEPYAMHFHQSKQTHIHSKKESEKQKQRVNPQK